MDLPVKIVGQDSHVDLLCGTQDDAGGLRSSSGLQGSDLVLVEVDSDTNIFLVVVRSV